MSFFCSESLLFSHEIDFIFYTCEITVLQNMKILTPLVLLLVLYLAHSQVIGIDFGTQFWKASLISPGKNLVIVENSRSQRKSYNGIAFLDGIRHFEYDAYQKRLKKPKSSYFYLNKLIESLDSQKPTEGYRFENGTYYFTQGDDTLSLEQLVGMILKNIKKYSSAQAGSDIKDAVLTVPAHWGFRSRMSLVNSAAIADLNVLGLINENSAAAIHFAITRNDTEPVNVGFFNLGSNMLQISIVQFFGTFDPVREKNIQSMKVLSHVSVPNMGGLHIDKDLADYVADNFKNQHQVDIRSNEKSWVKLLHKCADLKETLSANKEANIYIEGIINGLDLNMNVKREVIQKSHVFNQLFSNLQLAIDRAGIEKQDVQSVEIIGGASRIPLVNKIVKEFFDPIQVGSHINGDQSMAFGAALRAANLSIAFRVKQLHFYDGHPQQLRAVVTNIQDGVLSQTVLFNKNSEHGLKKQVIIDQNDGDVKVSIYYGEDLIHEYLLQNVSQWQERYDQKLLNFTQTPKLVLNFAAHSIHLAELKQAYINITLNTSTTKQVYELVVQNVTVQNEEKKPQANEQSSGQGEKEESKEETTQQSAEAETSSTSQEKKSKKTRQRTKNVKKIVQDFKIQNKKAFLRLNHQFTKYSKYSKEEVEKLKEIVFKYEKHQNNLREKSKVRNDFESTLYSLKDDYENQGFKTFSTESERQKLISSVSEQLNWLEDNAWTAQKQDFESHFSNIQKILNPIVNRSKEYNQRQQIYNKTIQLLSLVYSKTSELKAAQPWVEKQVDAHLEKVNKTVEQIHSQLKKQVERKPNLDVVFYNHQMIELAQNLREQYYLIKMIPRPKNVKKVEVETPKEPTTDEKVDLDDEEKEEGKDQKRQENNSEQAQNEDQDEQTTQQQNGEEEKPETKEDL